jgi:hypothetical protein
MDLPPTESSIKYRILYTVTKPLIADKNSSAPLQQFVSDSK